MFAPALLMMCCWHGTETDDRVKFMQVYPVRKGAVLFQRTNKREQAVILIHGLDLRDDGSSPAKPRFQYWQGSRSIMVREFSRNSDVFSLCYSQDASVEDIAWFVGIRRAIAKVNKLGYKRIVLVGHSAGGLVARHFVEDFPKSGVSAVIQIATPNGGCGLANWGIRLSQIAKRQRPFIASMGLHHRQTLMSSRQRRKIPSAVEFVVVVVTTAKGRSDKVVNKKNQWTRDLQLQRVPCVCVTSSHGQVLCHEKCIRTVGKLLSQRNPRWGRSSVFRMRRQLGLLPD